MNVAIIGAGPLGRWLALAAARAGFQVQLEDVMPANLHHAQEYIRREYSHEAAVAYVSTIEDAVRAADLVIDCVPDELESKLEIFCLLDRMAPPHTVIATPTTQLSIADLASCTYRADKCVGIVVDARRFSEANPPGSLVLRTGPQTSAETVELVGSFWRQLGFTPQFEPDPAAA
ncbi:MAG: 3-hydroxyacyl-CoA dehydrogenase NAD-binding domain-containing protein [Terracidiphilus sp.]|nr:3-hydroxyacyl-CoA dehydrogenase NAD-binding domain-containing protein [Terracidiphilus sp.]